MNAIGYFKGGSRFMDLINGGSDLSFPAFINGDRLVLLSDILD